jgi:hypothetical protein
MVEAGTGSIVDVASVPDGAVIDCGARRPLSST